MDWQILKVLEKAPRKKYIKKIVEYAVMIAPCQLAIPTHATTPIAQQFPQDLELTAQQAHRLVNALVELVKWCSSVDFDADRMGETLGSNLDQQLAHILVDLLVKMQEDIKLYSNMLVSQADRLISFDWQLDMEVATDKGKTNTPIVELQLSTAKESQSDSTKITMKGTQFDVFFRNLLKIKEQLSQLVSQPTE